MLENAILHEKEISELYVKIWFDEKYQYYFGGEYRQKIKYDPEDALCRDFVSLDKNGKILGIIGYRWEPQLRLANRFYAINFSDNKMVFALDLTKIIKDIFNKFNARTLEFSVICGNPIEKSYDNLIQKYGGEILCIRHNRAVDLKGNILDDKLYEITKEQYLNYIIKKKRSENEI